LHRQASFITAFFPPEAEAGTDYDWFPFPAIDQQGTLFAGEFAVVGRDAPEVRDFLERFSGEEAQCAMGGEPGSSRISPNTNVGPDCYQNPILADASEVLVAALSQEGGIQAGFDASDQMPAEVGSGSFWTGMVEYMQGGPDSLSGVLDEIEASWPT
jgi:alpha-glucoside transport system substrate-binding protein